MFYRRFRAKLANSDFSSIHVTPDWNEPDKKDPPTADPDSIAAEQAKYYKHLFGSKPSVRPERMLELLKGQSRVGISMRGSCRGWALRQYKETLPRL